MFTFMQLMEKTLLDQRDGLRRGRIRLAAIGELHRLPPRLRALLQEMHEESFGETPMAAESRNEANAAEGGGAAARGERDSSTAPNGCANGDHSGSDNDFLGTRRGRSEALVLSCDATTITREPSTGKATAQGTESGLIYGQTGSDSHAEDLSSLVGARMEDDDSGRPSSAAFGGDDETLVSARNREEERRLDYQIRLAGPPQQPDSRAAAAPIMTLCLAISYGGRAEVAAAARELAAEAAAGRLDPQDIDEDALGRRLSTARLSIPDPDLVVRTSGESRLSNLLLWQAAYTELYVVGKAWPEFRRPDLLEAFRFVGRLKEGI